eukprot:180266-Rhodomonas_salina.2
MAQPERGVSGGCCARQARALRGGLEGVEAQRRGRMQGHGDVGCPVRAVLLGRGYVHSGQAVTVLGSRLIE